MEKPGHALKHGLIPVFVHGEASIQALATWGRAIDALGVFSGGLGELRLEAGDGWPLQLSLPGTQSLAPLQLAGGTCNGLRGGDCWWAKPRPLCV